LKSNKIDLGDLFAIFPDLPWGRVAMTIASRGLRRARIAASVRRAHAQAEIARRRLASAVTRFSTEASRRRAMIRRQRPR
jgi:hypothetical protein